MRVQQRDKKAVLSKAKAKEAYEQWFRGVQRAYERIIGTPNKTEVPNIKKAYIEWVLKLVSKPDLESLSGSDFLDLQYEIASFLAFRGGSPKYNPWVIELGDDHDRFLNRQVLPDKEIVLKIMSWLKQSLHAILSKHAFGYRQAAYTVQMSWNPEIYGTANGSWHETIEGDDEDPNWMLIDFFVLLRTHVSNILKCPCGGCNTIFVRDRINQRFCSKKCQERQAKRDLHPIPPERYGKRGRPRAAATTELPQPTKGGTHGKKTRP